MSAGSSGAVIIDRIAAPVRGMHRAISSSWFGRIGIVAEPVRAVHDTISDVTYGSILLAATHLGPALDGGVDPASPSAMRLRSVVNSLWGDDLGRHENRVAIPMTAHDETGAIVDPVTHPPSRVTGDLVVLVHGISDTEASWAGDDGILAEIGKRPGLTPVTIRYNPGLPIAVNGTKLASLLDHLTSRWPVPVTSIALVGYSMGALVVHHAVAAGITERRPWAEAVTDVVAIGGPHTGSPIERAVGMAAAALSVAPVTKPLGDFLDSRSIGIKDLGIATELPDLSWHEVGTEFHFIAGVVTPDPTHPLGMLAGDLVVTPASGTAPTHLEPTNTATLGGTHHLGLLRDPAVVAQTMDWIDPPD